jgi:hypothetical protein
MSYVQRFISRKMDLHKTWRPSYQKLQIFVTCFFYSFVTICQYFLAGQVFCNHFEPIFSTILAKLSKLGYQNFQQIL